MTAYYNEFDPYAAQWLRNLIEAGHLPAGHVDDRDIRDVTPGDLDGYQQCHFFAGVGVWPLALARAGWPSDRRVWTGSCPCQPFSAAGRRAGTADERHLWPHWFHLIGQQAPDAVFGEQVAGKDALAWLDLVSADLEGEGYSIGAVDTCAAGYGAPHIRQRLYFAADRMGHPDSEGPQGREGVPESQPRAGSDEWAAGTRGMGAGKLEHAEGVGRVQRGSESGGGSTERGRGADDPGATNGFWSPADWLLGRDGKWRAVEPGSFPLAHGIASRVGRLRAYGGALVAPQAEGFVRAYMEVRQLGPTT